MSGVILDCSSTLFMETLSLNQTQNSLIKDSFTSQLALGNPSLPSTLESQADHNTHLPFLWVLTQALMGAKH